MCLKQVLINAKNVLSLIITLWGMYMQREGENDSWWDCSAWGFGDSTMSSSLPQSSWVSQKQRAVFWIGAMLITEQRPRRREERALKERRQRLGAKREGQERMSASTASSVHVKSLHPSLHRHFPSCPSSPFPAAGQFSPQQRKTSLMPQTKTSVCVQTKNREQNHFTLHEFSPIPSSSLSLASLSLPPTLTSSPHSTVSFSSSDSFHHPFLYSAPSYPFSFIFPHPPWYPSLLSLFHTWAVTPVAAVFGLGFQFSYNWLGVACCWADRSVFCVEVIMCQLHATESTAADWRASELMEFSKEDFDFYIS